MFEATTILKNKTGLHARPAAAFVKFCTKYPNKITLYKENTETNPKSIISILAGGYSQGSEIKVVVDGDDAEKVCLEIVEFIETLEE